MKLSIFQFILLFIYGSLIYETQYFHQYNKNIFTKWAVPLVKSVAKIEQYTPYRFPKSDLPAEPPKQVVKHKGTIAQNYIPHYKTQHDQQLDVDPHKPLNPNNPIQPYQPIQPIQPSQPIQPTPPIQQIQPIQPPIQPPLQDLPINPNQPIHQTEPIQHIQPSQPIKQVEPSVYYIHNNYNRILVYDDKNFPHSRASISKDSSFLRDKDIIWKRPEQFLHKGQIKLFDTIEPMDIKQGELGDCYLLSSLAALAEQPIHIERLFITKTFQENGKYELIMCIDGEMKEIILDDYFPCSNNVPIFSKSNGNELWVLLIEKAYAKVFGTYHKIESGLATNAMKDLTGAPCEFTVRKEQTMSEAQRFWDYIYQNKQKNYILTASSENDVSGKEVQKNSGIVSNHCYAILDAREVVDSMGLNDKIYKIRNPWGRKEWQGNWSDQSNKWTPQLRQQLKHDIKDDGIFWINYSDFITEFDSVCVCKLNTDYYFTSLSLKQDKKEFITKRVILMRVYQKQHAYITLSQKDKKFFENKKYSLARIIIGKIDPQTNIATTYLGSKMDNSRDVVVEGQFEAGDYAVYLEVDWNDPDRYLSIQQYGQQAVQFSEQQFSPKDINSTLDSLIILHEKFTEEEKVKDYGRNIKRISGEVAGYVYFTYINQNIRDTLKETVTFKERKSIEICEPFDNSDEFDAEVKPNETVFIKLRVTKAQDGIYSYQTSIQSYFIESFSDEDLIKSCLENPTKKAQRELRSGIIDVFVNSFSYSQGVAFYYQNKTNQIFREEVKFYLTNLKLMSHQQDQPLIINLAPNTTEFASVIKCLPQVHCNDIQSYKLQKYI
ncbi:hypothetical protein pb186bvf_009864 [Paramecium bursaria]